MLAAVVAGRPLPDDHSIPQIDIFVQWNDFNTDRWEKSFRSYKAVGASLFNFFTVKEKHLLISMILKLFFQKTI